MERPLLCDVRTHHSRSRRSLCVILLLKHPPHEFFDAEHVVQFAEVETGRLDGEKEELSSARQRRRLAYMHVVHHVLVFLRRGPTRRATYLSLRSGARIMHPVRGVELRALRGDVAVAQGPIRKRVNAAV